MKMLGELCSRLLTGKVMHERLQPQHHRFTYPVFLVRLDIDEIENETFPLNNAIFAVNKWRPLSLRVSDYGPRDGSSLRAWVNVTLSNYALPEATRIELQTFPRVFGYAFNPISLWYCYDQDDHMYAVIAEVNNTFGDHHFYLLKNSGQQVIDGQTKIESVKSMHVSPFCQVKGHYEFQFKHGLRYTVVKIDYFENVETTIKTAISAKLLPLSARNLLIALAKQPFLTFGVFWRIHWQAFLLWKKAVPFFRLPPSSAHKITIGTPIREEQ